MLALLADRLRVAFKQEARNMLPIMFKELKNKNK